MTNGMVGIAQALQNRSQSLGQASNNQMGVSPLGNVKAGLQGMISDDNSVKTPQANAEDVDRLTMVIMMMVDILMIIEQEHIQLMGGQSVLAQGTELPAETPQPIVGE